MQGYVLFETLRMYFCVRLDNYNSGRLGVALSKALVRLGEQQLQCPGIAAGM